MADFCRDCSLEFLGEDTGDLAGLTTADETSRGLYASVLCEDCGSILVDHEGRKVADDPDTPLTDHFTMNSSLITKECKIRGTPL